MRTLQVVLPQQILAVVVSVWRPDDCMDMLAVRELRIGSQMTQPYRPLMVELDQDHRAVNPIVENATLVHASDPREVRLVDMPADFFHLHPCVSVVHVANVLA